ncbi:MAG: flippase [Fluviibacter sp.]
MLSKRYLTNNAWALAERAVRLLITFFVGSYLVRYLGPSDYGKLSFVQGVMSIVWVVAALGLDNLLTIKLARFPKNAVKLAGSVFLIKTIAQWLVLGGLYVYLAVSGLESSLKEYVFILSLGVFIQGTNVVVSVLQSNNEFKRLSLLQFVQNLVSTLLKVAFIYWALPLVAFVYVLLIDFLIYHVGLYAIGKQKGMCFMAGASRKLCLQLLRDCTPLMLASVTYVLFIRVDQLMVQAFVGDAALGQYSAALRLIDVWYVLPVVFCTTIVPSLVGARRDDPVLYAKLVRRLYGGLAWLGIFIAIFMLYFGEQIIYLLYGARYSGSLEVVWVLALTLPLSFMGFALDNVLQVSGLNKQLFYRLVFSLCLLVGLNGLLLPRIGVSGAAYALLASLVLLHFGYDLMVKSLRAQVLFKLAGISLRF